MAELAAWLPMAMNVAGSICGAAGAADASDAALLAGQRQRAAAVFKAQQLRSQALQTVAASQRAGDSEERKARLLQSRALAVAAASGGGASDPTVINLIAGIAGEGSYRRMAALYEGEDRARTLRMQASAAEYEGAVAEEEAGYKSDAYLMQGMGSLVKGAGSLFSKYGGGGAPSIAGGAGDAALIGGFDGFAAFG